MRKLISVLILLFLMVTISSCKSDTVSSVARDREYLTELFSAFEVIGAEILPAESSVSMGGNDFYGGIILGNAHKENENCKVSFELGKSVKNLSFYLGSTHYEKAYRDGYETVCVYADGVLLMEKMVFNHDLPTYHTLSVSGAETVSFQTEGEGIITAIGELFAWSGDVGAESSLETSEDTAAVKLLYNVKPYYLSGEDNLICAYSENGSIIEAGSEVYTDAFEVYLPKISKWSNEYFAYFNLEGKYSYLSFKAKVSKIDDKSEISSHSANEKQETEIPLAIISIYCDDVLVFSEEITDFSLSDFKVPVMNCKKLCFVWQNVPDSIPVKMAVVGIYAEK